MSLRDEGIQHAIDQTKEESNDQSKDQSNDHAMEELNEESKEELKEEQLNELAMANKSRALASLDGLINDFSDLGAVIKELIKKTKDTKREFEREMRYLKKKTIRKTRRRPDAKPGGVCKPVKVSNQLADFIGIEHDELISRTQVSKKINEYIRNNSLQNLKDKRIIIADEALEKLFSNEYTKESKLDFFSLQKFIKHHYIKE